MNHKELLDKADSYRASREDWAQEVKRKLKEFTTLYPLREKPKLIDDLTPESIYKPGKEDYFTHWIENKLKDQGHISVVSNRPWKSARDNIGALKNLLKIAVDDSLTLSKKIDANW